MQLLGLPSELRYQLLEFKYILLNSQQKMNETTMPFQPLPQQLKTFTDYGYFGKPTKLRNLEPSMFELLTWNLHPKQPNQNQHTPQPNHQDACCQCKCHEPTTESKDENPTLKKAKSKNDNKPKNNKKQSINQGNPPKQANIEKPKQMGNKKTMARPQSANQFRAKSNEEKYLSQEKPKAYKNVKTVEDEEEQEVEINQDELINKFKQTTRWIPNSAFTTYFGKPAFQNYGRGNLKPAVGGIVYGNYLKSHNVQPHRGINSPKNLESYSVALMKASQMGPIHPYPPKVMKKENLSEASVHRSELQKSSIYPQKNHNNRLPIKHPNLYELQKFGGTGLKKISKAKYDKYSGDNSFQHDQSDAKQLEPYKVEYQYEQRKKNGMKGRK